MWYKKLINISITNALITYQQSSVYKFNQERRFLLNKVKFVVDDYKAHTKGYMTVARTQEYVDDAANICAQYENLTDLVTKFKKSNEKFTLNEVRL